MATKAQSKVKTRTLFLFTNRPSSGGRLKTYTSAVLHNLGMMGANRKEANLKMFKFLVGDKALAYHNKTLKTLAVNKEAGSVKVTERGVAFFEAREKLDMVDKDLKKAFVTAIKTGKPTAAQAKLIHCTPKDFVPKVFNV